MEWLPLTAGAPSWAERTVAARERERFDTQRSLARLESSSFYLAVSVETLCAIYEERDVKLSPSRLLETGVRTYGAGVV